MSITRHSGGEEVAGHDETEPTPSTSAIPNTADVDHHSHTESFITDSSHQRRLPFWRKLAYGLGGPPMPMLTNCNAFFLVLFLLETGGLNPFHNSVIQLVARVWDAVTDPLVGFFVAKTNTRWGRFRPWLIISAPLAALTFFCLYQVPSIASSTGRFVYYLSFVMLLQTAATTFHIPYSSMTMVLSHSREERDLCSMYRIIFENFGVLLGVGVFGSVVNEYRVVVEEHTDPLSSVAINNTSYSGQGQHFNFTLDKHRQRQGYMVASVLIGVLCILCSIVVVFGSRELQVKSLRRENFLKSLWRILTFKPYLLLMFAYLFVNLGTGTIQGNLALYVMHSLHRPEHITMAIVVVLGVSILVMPAVYKIMRIFGKKTAFVTGVLIAYPVLLVFTYLPDKPSLWLFYGMMVFAGVTVSVTSLVPWSMLPDVIDEFTLLTGVRKESVFYSLFVFLGKFAIGIAVALTSAILGFAGYKENSQTQPDSVGRMLRYLIGVSGIGSFSVALLFVYCYPINQTRLNENRNARLKVITNNKCDYSESANDEQDNNVAMHDRVQHTNILTP